MSSIWIEAFQSSDLSDIPTPGGTNYPWQGMFACQVGVMGHESWKELKWGFNAGALFDEALERQRLFLESQHSYDIELGLEHTAIRAIAFRFISTTNGLRITLMGKVSAKSKEQVTISACDYCNELISTFPYDYQLFPASSRDEFLEMTGYDLLMSGNENLDIVQIRRCEVPILANRNLPLLQGLWQASGRAHEQIWRSLSTTQNNIIVNIILRPTVLYINDIAMYSKLAAEISNHESIDYEEKIFSSYKEWYENFTMRRLTPWKKFYYLQYHIVTKGAVNESFIRTVGTTLTQNLPVQSPKPQTLHGYQAIRAPMNKRKEWAEKIYSMNLISWNSQLPDRRLSEIADLEEVYSVIRIPYSPPGSEKLGFKYLPVKIE